MDPKLVHRFARQPGLAPIKVLASYLSSDRREAHQNPANAKENRPNRTVLFKL
jgi:hypothetical protein